MKDFSSVPFMPGLIAWIGDLGENNNNNKNNNKNNKKRELIIIITNNRISLK